MKRFLLNLTLIATISLAGCDTLQQIAETAAGGTGVVNPTTLEIINGLKEALTNGAGGAVGTLSKAGGYFNDPLVKIPFPQEAEFAAKALRDIGLGGIVDDFEKRLNEGAEKGATLALPIFKNAIKQMTFADAKNILLGSETEATDYFREKTLDQLTATFSPKIKTSLDQVNATKVWSDITTRYNAIPFVNKKVETDIVKYATGKALDGLFLKLADEEKKIRDQPIARTSELLKKVFGFADREKGK